MTYRNWRSPRKFQMPETCSILYILGKKSSLCCGSLVWNWEKAFAGSGGHHHRLLLYQSIQASNNQAIAESGSTGRAVDFERSLGRLLPNGLYTGGGRIVSPASGLNEVYPVFYPYQVRGRMRRGPSFEPSIVIFFLLFCPLPFIPVVYTLALRRLALAKNVKTVRSIKPIVHPPLCPKRHGSQVSALVQPNSSHLETILEALL